MTFGSLFAGIGGFDLGFERAGMKCKWQVEIDDYATRVLEKHWPNVRRERDIRECGAHNLERVDVICGGFPCQDISVANTAGEGLDGKQSGLFFEAVRVVRELRPRVLVLENVSALLNSGLDRVLRSLAEIGFDAEWHCIPAASIGAPHIRDRMFIFANAKRPRRKGRFTIERPPSSSPEAFPVALHKVAGSWVRLDGNRRRIRNLNGLSVGVERTRLRGLGNAVVPAVAQYIGRQIMEYAK